MSSCIVVADDDEGIRRLIVTTLTRMGYQVLEAANGRQTLEAMASGDAGLVVLDLRMPELSGWDVLAERRLNPALNTIPIIVVSADVDDGDLGEAQRRGECVVLSKPFDLPKLLGLVVEQFPRPVADEQSRERGEPLSNRVLVVEEDSALLRAAKTLPASSRPPCTELVSPPDECAN